uniref:Uncharacterized protein n=1 Tax=Rhizophora mucronata TaxID=61149 RepID=A0A2P2MMQ0_RHIMU
MRERQKIAQRYPIMLYSTNNQPDLQQNLQIFFFLKSMKTNNQT